MVENIGDTLDELDREFQSAFGKYEPTFQQLQAAPSLSAGEKHDLKVLERIGSMGLSRVYSRRRAAASREKLLCLVRDFCATGPSAALKTGTQRGGDFLLNQLRGQWAERVCGSIDWPGHKLLPFGPSGAAMPGEDDHVRVVRTFREIMLIEGKRPDLIVFESEYWDQLSESERKAASEWPNRLLTPSEHEIVKAGRCGIEVKNSTWHYSKRRASNRGSLAVTVKNEEIEPISAWSSRYEAPVLFMQVLFDEVYCMSFLRMRDAIKDGRMYEPDDYIVEKNENTFKYYHRFLLNGETHLCAKTVFPDESKAVVSVLPDGCVIPHIRFDPAATVDPRPEVMERELAYRSDTC